MSLNPNTISQMLSAARSIGYSRMYQWRVKASAKATHIFSAKNIRILYIESAKSVNEMTLNELDKLTALWTTGPWMRPHACAGWCESAHFAHALRPFYVWRGPNDMSCVMGKGVFEQTWPVTKENTAKTQIILCIPAVWSVVTVPLRKPCIPESPQSAKRILGWTHTLVHLTAYAWSIYSAFDIFEKVFFWLALYTGVNLQTSVMI